MDFVTKKGFFVYKQACHTVDTYRDGANLLSRDAVRAGIAGHTRPK